MAIKNIIFDLGGVILNIDYNKTERAFIELGISHFREIYTQHFASDLFQRFETGKISSAHFIAAIQQQSAKPLSAQKITDAWNAMLLDFPPERIDLLQQLRSNYTLFLLSNTNAIHLKKFQEILFDVSGLISLDALFTKTYYSHIIGLRKPDAKSYKLILAENNLKTDETLFIDDSPGNIEGAKKTGLHTILLQSPQTILDIFEDDKLNY